MRKESLRGLRAAVFGGVISIVVLGLLQLGFDWLSYLQDRNVACSKDGEGPFANTPFEFLLPTLSMIWLIAVVVEPALPRTWRHQELSSVFGRFVSSMTVWAIVATFIFLLSTVCN